VNSQLDKYHNLIGRFNYEMAHLPIAQTIAESLREAGKS
jgi:hypothetical protein